MARRGWLRAAEPKKARDLRLRMAGGRSYRGVVVQDQAIGTDLDKRFVFKSWIFALYLDITNVTNRANVEGYAHSYDYTQKTTVLCPASNARSRSRVTSSGASGST